MPAASPPYQRHSPFAGPRCPRVTNGRAMTKHNAIKIAVLETLVMTDKSNELSEALPARGQVEAGKRVPRDGRRVRGARILAGRLFRPAWTFYSSSRDPVLHMSANTFAQLLKVRHVQINRLHHRLSSCRGSVVHRAGGCIDDRDGSLLLARPLEARFSVRASYAPAGPRR